METNINAGMFLVMAVPAPAQFTPREEPQAPRQLQAMEIVVDVHLDASAGAKIDVSAITDAGNELFALPLLTSCGRNGCSTVDGMSMSFPRWVRLSWQGAAGAVGRSGPGDADTCDYHVDVLSRIPVEAFSYAAAEPGRAMALKFCIKDDGVMFAWAVQENGALGEGRLCRMEGGDF